ncbi:MAG: hypothetical protein KJ645_08160 [Planctomycetes bacterium]|nr:hypothetical protein [Planctomycetota bacterium]
MIKTIAQAHRFVKKVKLCTVFPSNKVEHTSLWENVDLPDKQAGETGWGQKMNAVWTWKTRLPAEYPNDIFYGKIKGGLAVLMDMEYMADIHFPQAYKRVRNLSRLAQYINDKVSAEPWDTTTLRETAMQEFNCTKSRFDTALKNLQITMNIVRLNDSRSERDTWVPFRELYLDVWRRYVDDE